MSVSFHKQGVIPNLLYFVNKGIFSGSYTNGKEFCYIISPDNSTLNVDVWYGPLNHAHSEIFDRREFHLSEDGREDLLVWLEQICERMLQ